MSKGVSKYLTGGINKLVWKCVCFVHVYSDTAVSLTQSVTFTIQQYYCFPSLYECVCERE